jgi:aquaporin Z
MLILEKIKVEFVGMFLYVFLSGMAIIQYSVEATDIVSMCVCLFCSICITLWFGKSISGGEYNPLLSLCLLMTRHQSLEDTIFKISAQVFGALFATSLLYTITSTEIIHALSANSILGIPEPIDISIVHIFLSEFLGSFFIVLFYYVLIVDVKSEKHVFAPALGAVHFFLTIRTFNTSGAYLNLARLIGYMLTAGKYTRWWIYVIALPAGSVCGALLGNYIIPKVRRGGDDTELMSEMGSVVEEVES